MKRYFKTVLAFSAIAALLTYSGCGPGSDPAPTEQEVQLGKLKSTWKITEVKLDNVSKLTDYTGFELTITGSITDGNLTGGGYSAKNRPKLSPWLAEGNWVFGTDPVTQITRDPDKSADKLDVTYSVTDTQLQLTFTFAREGYSTARTSNVKGQWVFTFKNN
ncbi:MAG: hypothetical protein ACOYW3_00270 [Bacteroidota bacterium]